MGKQRVLILCTGNSARSQMAEGLLRHDGGERFEVKSAGTKPGVVRPEAVCDNAKESCPVFFGAVKGLHHGFDDPPPASEGTDEERMAIFRRVRDELRAYLAEFAKPRT